ncbi:MAG: methylenetetrahydrofolate reductase [Candidatus Omnitrophica bacterium]|nr:methylenetetrahydrofolate reductase [Candidatus Omnitrophota bacterium]
MRVESHLEKLLNAGRFVVTVEVGPPRGPDHGVMRKKADLVRSIADACNVTDNQTAVVRMSSIAGARILLEEGLEPVMQMTCRDRNRIAIQSDLLGASALGIRNCLCISGDHQKASAGGRLKGHPGSKNVYDIDSIQLISIVRGLRDDARQEGGDSIKPAAHFFIGAAWTPLSPPEDFRLIRLQKKIDAGADFIQTQAVYDVKRFGEAVSKALDMGLTDRVAILAGVIVPRSAGMLRYMEKNVPGVEVPESLIDRMKSADDPREEGIKVSVELINAIGDIPGIRGVHLQAIESEELLPEVAERAGLLPRPERGNE